MPPDGASLVVGVDVPDPLPRVSQLVSLFVDGGAGGATRRQPGSGSGSRFGSGARRRHCETAAPSREMADGAGVAAGMRQAVYSG